MRINNCGETEEYSVRLVEDSLRGLYRPRRSYIRQNKHSSTRFVHIRLHTHQLLPLRVIYGLQASIELDNQFLRNPLSGPNPLQIQSSISLQCPSLFLGLAILSRKISAENIDSSTRNRSSRNMLVSPHKITYQLFLLNEPYIQCPPLFLRAVQSNLKLTQ